MTDFNPGKLRKCPECDGKWPSDPDHALRGCGWLGGLPRSISPSNSDIQIHDGGNRRNRFLHLEFKAHGEPWPMRSGQAWHLRALAGQPNWIVRVLRGSTFKLEMHAVSGDGIDPVGIPTHAEAVRNAVALWLNGSLWRDAEAAIPDGPPSGHVCGWARHNGLWVCEQDYHAVGRRPDTSCGATLPQYADGSTASADDLAAIAIFGEAS